MTTTWRTVFVPMSMYGAMAVSLWGCGDDSGQQMLPAPTLASVSPKRAATAGGEMLMLTGTGFQSGAVVTVAGTICDNPIITDTQISCTLPPNPGKCGAQPVVITNPDDQQATISTFTYYGSVPSFAAPANMAVGTGPQQLAFGDFNGDQKLDLVTANQTGNSISLLLGKGDGTFGMITNANAPAKSAPSGIAVGDLNHDMKLDVVTVGTGGTLNVFLGSGAGTFAMPTSVAFKTKTVAQGVAIGSVIPSGKGGDVVTADPKSSTATVLAGNGMGGFGNQTQLKSMGATGGSFVMLADLNGN